MHPTSAPARRTQPRAGRPHPRSTASFALVLAACAAAAPAQQQVAIAVEGIAQGADAFGAPSFAVLQLGDAPPVHLALAAGIPPFTVAQQLANTCAQLGAVANVLGDEVQIFTGPFGQPLTTGVSFGTSDLGHSGVSCRLQSIGPPVPWKTDGCTLPQLPPGAGLLAGQVWIDIDVEVQLPAGPGLVRHTALVPTAPGEPTAVTNQNVLQALRQLGLSVHQVVMASNLVAGALHPCLQLDSDRDGNPVRRCIYRAQVDGHLQFDEVHVGRDPFQGATTYGQPWNVDAMGVPLQVMAFPDLPQLGQRVEAVFETRVSFRFCIALLGFARADLPVPAFGPGAVLLVDPVGALALSGLADAFGDFHAGVVVPPDPRFAGLELFWTGVDLDPAGLPASRLSRGLITVVR